MDPRPVALRGRYVALEPLGERHAPGGDFSVLDDEWPAVKARLEPRLTA